MPRCKRCTAGDECTFKHGLGGYTNHGCRCDVCCVAQSARGSAYYAANRERIDAKNTGWRKNNPEAAQSHWRRYRESNRDQINASTREHRRRRRESDPAERHRLAREKRAWRASNPESERRSRDKYLAEHPGAVHRRRDLGRAWYQRNRDYAIEQVERRSKRLKGIPVSRRGPYSPAEDALILNADLSLVEAAFMLGRSYDAVRTRRQRLTRLGMVAS